MRRLLTIVSWVIAVGLFAGGGALLVKASRSVGWEAAGPAVGGVGCWVVAAAFMGRHVTGLVAYPFGALLGHVFYPASHFTAPPKSLLLSLRARIADRQFRSVEKQLDGLLKAYPRDVGLFHLWALLETARGRGVAEVTDAAARALSKAAFADYEARVLTAPNAAGRKETGRAGGR